jgi:hypothetical protein
MKLLYSVLAIIAFYLFYWIGRSILFSFIDGTWTLESILKANWYIAGVTAFLICLVADLVLNDDAEDSAITGMIIAFCTVIATFLPYSIGLAVLYQMIVVGCMVYTIWTSTKLVR